MWHEEITEQTKWRGKNGVSRNKWRRKGDGIQEANIRKYKLKRFNAARLSLSGPTIAFSWCEVGEVCFNLKVRGRYKTLLGLWHSN
jgi:hypothetical protein